MTYPHDYIDAFERKEAKGKITWHTYEELMAEYEKLEVEGGNNGSS